MADDDLQPIMMSEADAAKLEKLLGLKIRGVGVRDDGAFGFTIDPPAARGQSRRGSDDFFLVYVKANGGSDGNATTVASWKYDLYPTSDLTAAEKMNKAGAIEPFNSAARIIEGTVTKAPDGSEAMAFFDEDGAIQLWDCQETRVKKVCT